MGEEGESDTISDSESGGTCVWGAGDAGGGSDHSNDWVDPGEGEDWIEEFGLQFGSILCAAGGLNSRGAPNGQRGPEESLENP